VLLLQLSVFILVSEILAIQSTSMQTADRFERVSVYNAKSCTRRSTDASDQTSRDNDVGLEENYSTLFRDPHATAAAGLKGAPSSDGLEVYVDLPGGTEPRAGGYNDLDDHRDVYDHHMTEGFV
jgi:hypothetical protein